METITFTCKILTPMFLAGADGKTPELRAASIKGALRFWWRACHGHLGLDSEVKQPEKKGDKDVLVTAGLRDQESFIFGGAGGGQSEGRSSFTIQVRTIPLGTSQKELVPHKPFMKAEAFTEGQIFEVVFRLPKVKGTPYHVLAPINGREQEIFGREKLIALFQLTCILGGVGKRARRGMGSLAIESANSTDSSKSPIEVFQSPGLTDIHSLLTVLSPHFALQTQSNKIQNVYSGRMAKYPWITQIEIGRPTHNPTLKISNATHEVKGLDSRRYEPSMGHAFKGRFASPLVTSVLSDGRPIITTLNTVPDRDVPLIDPNLQSEFRKRVL